MRPTLAVALGFIATGVAAGCTLLVPFDDPPPLDTTPESSSSSSGRSSTSSSSSSSGGATSSSSSSGSMSSSTSSSSSSGSVYPPACDRTNLAGINCAAKADGTYCGLNGVANDLVQCQGGTAVCVFKCTMGCAALATGIDQCADCKDPTLTNEWYCGKDVQWPGAARDYAFECTSGQLVAGSPSACGLDKCHTTCTRISPPPLQGSCCQSTPE